MRPLSLGPDIVSVENGEDRVEDYIWNATAEREKKRLDVQVRCLLAKRREVPVFIPKPLPSV